MFMYKDFEKVFAIEQVMDAKTRKQQKEQMEVLREIISRIMLAVCEQRSYKDTPRGHYSQYCKSATIDQILKAKDLFSLFDGKIITKASKTIPSQPKDSKVDEMKFQEALKQMQQLQISMGSEIKPVEEIQIKILSRVLQVSGSLFEYNPLEENNILRVKDVFLCLDQTDTFSYMLNIVD